MADLNRLSEQERLYRENRGEEALERQRRAAAERYGCCGGLRRVGHKAGCRFRKDRR